MIAPQQIVTSRPRKSGILSPPPQPGSSSPSSWQTLVGRVTPAQRFLVASLLILLSGMAGIGWWISSQIEHGILSRSAFTTALYVDSFISQPLQSLATSDALDPAAVAELDRLLTTTALGKEVVAFKLWGPGGRVIYSGDQALVGQAFPVGEELQAAWDGRVNAQFSTLDHAENVYERLEASRLLETYSPVRAHGSGEVIAVAEFYQGLGDLEAIIAGTQRRSWLVLLAVTLAMYMLLGGYVHRVSATIVRQGDELQAQVARLEELLSQNEELGERVRLAAARAAASNERMLRRISAELHDGPAQYLGLAILRLDRVTAACERLPQPGRALEDIEQIHGALSQAMQEVRGISAGLGLPQLDQLSLEEVVARAVRAHERRTGTHVAVRLADLPEHACQATKIAVYRVVQEGLNNAYKHAGGAGQSIELAGDGDEVHLWVSDQGPGCAPPRGEWDEHMGLAGMRDRVESLGGEFAVFSQPGGGTRVFAALPLTIEQESNE